MISCSCFFNWFGHIPLFHSIYLGRVILLINSKTPCKQQAIKKFLKQFILSATLPIYLHLKTEIFQMSNFKKSHKILDNFIARYIAQLLDDYTKSPQTRGYQELRGIRTWSYERRAKSEKYSQLMQNDL